MTNFNMNTATVENFENAFAEMLSMSAYGSWWALFDREEFEEEFAQFIGVENSESLWENKAFVEWYNETAEEL